MSREINTINAITKVPIQMVQINPINFDQQQGTFKDIGAIVELKDNEIISHGYLFLFSSLFSF